MLFLVLLLSITASSHASLDHLLSPKKLFRNPRKFVDAFSQANPATLNSLLDKIDAIIHDGTAEMQKAIDNTAALQKAFNQKAAELEAATESNLTATGNHAASGETLDSAIDQVTINAKKVEAAKKERDVKKDALDQATKTKDATLEKTNAEAEDFKEILELVAQLTTAQQGSGRRLLESGEGDVEKITNYVVQMRDVSTEEAEAVKTAFNLAQNEYTSASDIFERLTVVQINLVESRKKAQTAFDQTELLLDDAINTVNAATKSHADANRQLTIAKEFSDSETLRVTNDNKVLNEVKVLIKGLQEIK